jgi:hypothetical protein
MNPTTLTLEQQFSLRSFEDQVNRMSLEQAQEFLIKLYKHQMEKENFYRHILMNEWGIAPNGDLSIPINPDGSGDYP